MQLLALVQRYQIQGFPEVSGGLVSAVPLRTGDVTTHLGNFRLLGGLFNFPLGGGILELYFRFFRVFP